MNELNEVAPAFVEMAHRIVWASAATVDPRQRPRSRILHPYWEWSDGALVGWVATGPTPVKAAGLANSPYMSVTYWHPSHDTCTAECRATWLDGPGERERIWQMFVDAPEPVGYDPAIVPAWKDGPTSPAFGALRLDPWRLRVFPGTALLGAAGSILEWSTS
jgi:hypothetical protein